MPAWSLPEAAFGPAGAIIASLVAASVTFAGLIISKEQKTSEFRQAWIDALRSDAASAVAGFIAFSEATAYGGPQASDRAERRAEVLAAYRKAEAAVRLRLNPNEERSKLAFQSLDQINQLLATGDLATSKTTAAAADFVGAIQPILKAEWARVKRGEFWFRATKFGTLIAIVAAVGLLVLIYHGTNYSRATTPRPGTVTEPASPTQGTPH